MKNLLRASLLAPLLAGSALVATPAFAQEESDITVSANVAMVTDYRFRGVSYSGGDFAIQGGFDIAHSSGFYIGTWASSLEPTSTGYGNTELDIYGVIAARSTTRCRSTSACCTISIPALRAIPIITSPMHR